MTSSRHQYLPPTPEDIVETKFMDLFDTPGEPMHLVRGGTLPGITVAYETYGTLNERRDNAIYICHALTGDAHAAGYHEGDDRPGWWDALIGPGKAIDTDRWFVVASNILGGCSGTTGPSSVNPETGKPYENRLPPARHARLRRRAPRPAHQVGVPHLHAAVGGSLGACRSWTGT